MKKLILVVMLIALLVIAVAPIKLVRLRVINKSGYPLKVSMTGQEFNQPYYLGIDKGSRSSPLEAVYTIIPDKYKTFVYYDDGSGLRDCISELVPVNYWDWEAESVTLDFRGNSKLVITECGYPPPNKGDPSVNMFKWYWRELFVY